MKVVEDVISAWEDNLSRNQEDTGNNMLTNQLNRCCHEYVFFVCLFFFHLRLLQLGLLHVKNAGVRKTKNCMWMLLKWVESVKFLVYKNLLKITLSGVRMIHFSDNSSVQYYTVTKECYRWDTDREQMTGRITQNHKFTITWYEPQTRPPKPNVPLSTHTPYCGEAFQLPLHSLQQRCKTRINA